MFGGLGGLPRVPNQRVRATSSVRSVRLQADRGVSGGDASGGVQADLKDSPHGDPHLWFRRENPDLF